MRTFTAAAAGFLTLFNFLLLFMMLLFIWPRMLPSLADGTYLYMDTVKFILTGCLFVGFLGAGAGVALDDIDAL